MYDAILDRGLFGDADMHLGAATVPLLAPGRPKALVSYCLRHVLLFLHNKVEHMIVNVWRDDDCIVDRGCARKPDGNRGPDHSQGRDEFIRTTQHMIDVLIKQRMDVLFGSTCTLIVVCCVFCSGKVWNTHVGFGRLCHTADISTTRGRLAAHQYYNDVFLPIIYGFERKVLYGK